MNSPHMHHSTLNANLSGLTVSTSPHIVRYRNIKYASIPERFARAEPIDDWKNASLNCTSRGPRCPQVPVNLSSLFRIPPSANVQWSAPEDEFECCNLDITLPGDAKPGDNLPVMVWCHGGAHIVTCGDIDTKTADPEHIVATSMKLNSPVIVININYRLNIFGYLPLHEIALQNLALHDQRLALQFIQNHVREFGGNPKRVTLFGESAGSSCTHAHLQSTATKELLNRAILMSGALPTNVPASPAGSQAQEYTKTICNYFGIDATATDMIAKLQAIPAAELVQAQKNLGITGAFFVNNSEWFDGDLKPNEVPEWLDAIMLGDVQWEGIIWNKTISTLSTKEIVELFPQELENCATIMNAYGIGPDLDPVEARKRVLEFIGDVKFNYPMHLVAKGTPTKTCKLFRYIVDQPSPLDEKVPAHHTVDLILLFAGYPMSEDGKNVSETMQKAWIKFANGEDPWKNGDVMGFGPGGSSGQLKDGELEKRRRVEQFNVLENLGLEGWRYVAGVVAKNGKGSLEVGF